MKQTPIVLRGGALISGKYYAPGDVLPYTSEDEVPPSLRPLIAGSADEIPSPPVRDVYTLPAHLRRQGRELEREAWEREQAERQAGTPLPEDVREILAEQHAARIEKLRAQSEYNSGVVDAAHEIAAAETTAKTSEYFVRRGGMWAAVARARLKPGEVCFVRRPNGEFEASGFVDSQGEPPPSEIHT